MLPLEPPAGNGTGHCETMHLPDALDTPATCTALWKWATIKNRHRNRCIKVVSLEYPEFTTDTTAILSQWHTTKRPTHRGPHTATANRIGSSSFGAISQSGTASCHCHWNHWDPQRAPHPQQPDASDSTAIAGIVKQGITATPFHSSMNCSHHLRSDRVAAFKRIHRPDLLAVDSNSIRRRTKVRPGRTTVAACCRWPSRDSRSLFLHAFLTTHSATFARIRCNFSCGSLTTRPTVSISKPKNIISADRPEHFAGATGTPSRWHTSSIASMFDRLPL